MIEAVTSGASDDVRVVRTLKEGYWDRIEVIECADGSLRVRKSSRADAAQGPWGVAALRLEIRYLQTLPSAARAAFPALLAHWDDAGAVPPRLGYEVPFYPDHVDAGQLARACALTQPQVDAFQDQLAEVLFEQVHAPVVAPRPALSEHVQSAILHALAVLEQDATLARMIDADTLALNGELRLGTRAALARIYGHAGALRALDAAPQVRLHGDFFLENMLLGPDTPTLFGPRLVLIDPVSVAGVVEGSPLFDLVKYESYATGELFALRKGLVEVSGFEGDEGYRSVVHWEHPELAPFRLRDWRSRFRARFDHHYGPSDPGAYYLLEGYFGVVMAVNTSGQQRRARLLGATRAFNLAADRVGT